MILRIARVALACALGLAPLARAESGSSPTQPLSANELEAVVQEIKAMVKTDESRVTRFDVREATPERIDALYRMPELIRLPKNIRENGLIFAGRGGTLLTFDKPSDVIAKVSSWFPEEIARARGSKNQRLWTGDIHLWGPFENWAPEPAAFLALWNCMPQSAWLRPGRNPFQRRLNDSLPLYPIAARQSSEQEFDFGFCVRERNGVRSARTMEELRANQESVHRIAERISPLLGSKFARFLASQRCQGKGPDDCVLVLRLWASLSPADAELAATMQALEAEIAPDGPLPELRNPSVAQSDSTLQDGQDRFDEGLRKAAYLRAKLLSVLNAPHAWPAESLAATLHQMTRLRQAFAVPFVHRWYQYEIDYRNDPINPWRVLDAAPGSAQVVRLAIMEELDRIGGDTDCEVLSQWFEHGGKSLQTVYALRRLADGLPLRCAAPDWEWLQQADDDEARYTRYRSLALLGHLSGRDQDMLLSGLTQGGERCFDKKSAPPDWLQQLCRTWISEPQQVRYNLQYSRTVLNGQKRFRMTKPMQIPPSVLEQRNGARIDQEKWLTGLVPEAATGAAQKMREIAAEFNRRNVWVETAREWHHPASDRFLIELGVNLDKQDPEPSWPFVGPRLLLVVEPQSVALVGVPGRFGYQYDEGEIANVSDIDQDGNLEVWFSGTFGECDGEDAKPGIDCAVEAIHMGEIRGDAVSYFANTPGKKIAPGESRTDRSNGSPTAAAELRH